MLRRVPGVIITAFALFAPFATEGHAADLPDAATVKAVPLFEVDHYCEGVVFDHRGRGYVSHGKVIEQFTLDGQQVHRHSIQRHSSDGTE